MSHAASSARPTAAATAAEGWLQRGHRLAATGDTVGRKSALDCYNHALACIPESTTEPSEHRLRGLAQMNRGNQLQAANAPEDVAAAQSAYAAALLAFDQIPQEPGVANSAAVVRLNRGRAHLRLGDPKSALEDFRMAWTALDQLAQAGDPLAPRNAAGAAVNLAQLSLQTNAPSEELPVLLAKARSHLADRPQNDAIAATLALEIARLDLHLAMPQLSGETLGRFTDTVEDALTLAARWMDRQHPNAPALALHLFRLGAIAYGRFQPHFLLEYLREGLDPACGPAPFAALPEFHQIATDVLGQLRDDIVRPRMLREGDDSAHAWVELAQEVNAPHPWLRANSNVPAASSA